jgi:hypothetical protein
MNVSTVLGWVLFIWFVGSIVAAVFLGRYLFATIEAHSDWSSVGTGFAKFGAVVGCIFGVFLVGATPLYGWAKIKSENET